jgi:two-component system, response regulator RegA
MTEKAATSVLLVEDDKTLRDLLRAYLDMSGYQIYEADCRPDALQTIRDNPDLQICVVDLGLPPDANYITEGVLLLKELGLLRPSLKSIVLSGQTQNHAIEESIRFCAFDFLRKPTQMHTLLAAINRASLFIATEKSLSDRGITCLSVSGHVASGIKHLTDTAEEKLLRKVLIDTDFNINRSANLLGMKRESIYYFMKKFEIHRHD